MSERGEASPEFLAVWPATRELADALMRLAPANPFCTRAYAEAMSAKGEQPWLLGIGHGSELIGGCYGFYHSGRLNRILRVESLPAQGYDEIFWSGLLKFCSHHGVSVLEVAGAGFPGTLIPALPGETERRDRCEYVLHLSDPEWEWNISHGHRYDIKKAIRSGVTLRRSTSIDACREHVRLIRASLERRRKRGETIIGDLAEEFNTSLLLTQNAAAELFQAVAVSEVLSSALVVKAAEGADLQSSGTSGVGMKCGASPFLIYSTALLLRQEGIRVFNLGAAEPNEGLKAFKQRFGAKPMKSQLAMFYLGSGLRRKLSAAARLFREMPIRFRAKDRP